MSDIVSIDQGDLDDLGDKFTVASERMMSELTNGKTGRKILEIMRKSAWINAPKGDTLTLSQSIVADEPHVEVDKVSLTISTNTYYAVFQEYGTGILGDPDIPHVQKAYWYQFDGYDEKGKPKFIKRFAQKGHRFMRGAIEGGNLENIKLLLLGVSELVFKEAFDD